MRCPNALCCLTMTVTNLEALQNAIESHATTAAGESLPADTEAIAGLVARIRGQTPLPVGIGFGITRPEQAAAVAQMADAVVVGTEISRRIEEAADPAEAVAQVGRLAREMKRATHRSGRGR